MAVLSLGYCVGAFSSCGEWGLLYIMVLGHLTVVASLVLQDLGASRTQQLWCMG